jgi:hypothetical protein
MQWLRQATFDAAEAAGNKIGGNGAISYLSWLAIRHPASFTALLARSLPQQVDAEEPVEEEEVTYRTVEEIREGLLSI